MKRIFNKFTCLTAVIMLAVFVSCGNLSNTSSVTPPPSNSTLFRSANRLYCN